MSAPAEDAVAAAATAALAAQGRRRRTTELGLLVLAVLVILGAYALASLGRSASLPADIVPFLGVLIALLVVAHLATRRLAPQADPLFLPLAAVLNGIGYVFIARLDTDLAGLQAGWTAVGIFGYVATLVVVRDVRLLERYRYTFGLIGIVLLLLPLVPGIGQEINGSRIWVSIGPVNFQPGEFAEDRARDLLRRLPDRATRAARASRPSASDGSTRRTPSTSRRCCWRSACRSPWWCSSATSARRCCSSCCSW